VNNPQGLKIVFGILAGLLFFHGYIWYQWRTGRLMDGWRVWQRFVHSARSPLSHWKEEDVQMERLRAHVDALREQTPPPGETSHE